MSSPSMSGQSLGSRARFKRPQRMQIEWRPMALNDLLPADHRARVVWAYVDSLDLSALYGRIQAVEDGPGRDAVDPKILLALWMFATIEAVSSARQLERLSQRDLAYMWICGGVGVNYHLLSDFRSNHADFLDQLLTDTIATLIHQDLITLNDVAQDGMRVRANAGCDTFRRKTTLEKCHAEAQEHLRKLNEERESEEAGGASDVRREAARHRAAKERAERLEQARQELDQLADQKERQNKDSGDVRCSMTDPEARKMKMGDGGFRPAFNVELATDGDTRLIVAVEVTNAGNDLGQMAPLHENIQTRYEKSPKNYMVDGGFVTKDDITQVEKSGTAVLAPIYNEAKMIERGNDPHARKRGDSDEMFAFRQRMATPEAKELYKKRPSIAEFPNAEFRNRGLGQFRVRGLKKAKAVSLLHAITFNFMRMMNLGYLENLKTI